MKINIMKITLTVTAFVALISISTKNTFANGSYGSYGSDTVLGVTSDQKHEVVDAGLSDISLQTATIFISLSGLIATSVLLKKTK